MTIVLADVKTEKPTQDQINEVIDPTLSQDSFKLGDKTFPVQILPISYEKKITLLVFPLLKRIKNFKDKTVADILQEIVEEDVENGFDTVVKVVYTICQRYEKTVTEEWLSDNFSVLDFIPIIVKQFEKYTKANAVSSFFLTAAKLMPLVPKEQESPTS
jgi:hypothetical protein